MTSLKTSRFFPENPNWKDERRLSIWVLGYSTSLMSVRELWALVFSKVVMSLTILIGSSAAVASTATLKMAGFETNYYLMLFCIVPVFVNCGSAGLMSIVVYLNSLRPKDKQRAYVSVPSILTVIAAAAPACAAVYNIEFRSGVLPHTWFWPAMIIVPLIYNVISEFFHFVVFCYISPSIWSRRHIWPATEEETPPVQRDFAEPDLAAPEPAASDAPVEMGKTRVPPKALLLLEAQGNYLRIVMRDQESLERFRISEAVKSLPADLGVSVHRSRWVAFKAIDRLEQVHGQYRLRLENDEMVTIASTREAAVLEELSKRGIGPIRVRNNVHKGAA